VVPRAIVSADDLYPAMMADSTFYPGFCLLEQYLVYLSACSAPETPFASISASKILSSPMPGKLGSPVVRCVAER
jgi:hypothetical protein